MMNKYFYLIFLGIGIATLPVMAQAKWTPAQGTSWQWQLQGIVNQNYGVSVYDVDLFDVSQNEISSLKSQGRRIICYFSAGSAENWRQDFPQFLSSELGRDMDMWPGEMWLDTRSSNVRNIMKSRLDLASKKGCDAVEPDNVDGYEAETGFSLTYETQIGYLKFLSEEAHSRGLSIGLKNDIGQINDLSNYFDFAVNEECFAFNECNAYLPFIESGKAVFNAEYTGDPGIICQIALSMGFSTIFKNRDLDDERIGCEGESSVIPEPDNDVTFLIAANETIISNPEKERTNYALLAITLIVVILLAFFLILYAKKIGQ